MKHVILLILLTAVLAFVFGCGSDDNTSTQPTPGPNASFTVSGATVTPATISFTNTSENADHYQWDFGDGRTSVQASPTMAFDAHGQYTITLIATQSSSSRSDTSRQTISITPGMAFLDSARVEQIPFTDQFGAGWDLTTGPDLFFDLIQGSTTIRTSSTITDLTPQQLPVTWYFTPEYRMMDWATSYNVNLYDYDAASANDFIVSVSFSVNGVISQSGYQNSITLRNASQTIRVALVVRWQ
jgi:PKD repeat protein